MTAATAVGAVILAAGTSSRYRASGGTEATKLVAPFDGRPVVRRVAEIALAGPASPVVVVTGHAETAVRAALSGLERLVFAHNAAFASGLASSLRTGLAALPRSAVAALVLLGDMPLVDGEVLAALAAAFARAPDRDAVVPVRGGHRGNPVLIARSMFAAASRLAGDEGARRLLLAADVAEVEVVDGDIVTDIDEVADLDRVTRHRAGP